MAYSQGIYYPINKEKYLGKTNPRYLSSWEYRAFIKLDMNPSVVRWGSEIIVLPYLFEVDGKKHRYYVDLYVENIGANGEMDKLLIEIKPDEKLFAPVPPKNKTPKAMKNYKYRFFDYQKNINKWTFASGFAAANGMTFMLLTEKGMYIFSASGLEKISEKKNF